MGESWMSDEQKQRQAVWERTHGRITTKIAGVTFENEDGTPRQKYLKEAYANDGAGTLELVPFEYKGENALRVLFDGNCVGTIPKNRVAEILGIMDRVTAARLDVQRFTPEDDDEPSRAEKIYRADLILIYAKDPPDNEPEPTPAPDTQPVQSAPATKRLEPEKKTKKANAVPIICIILLALTILGSMGREKDRTLSSSAATKTATANSAPTKSTPTPDPATAYMTLSQKNAYKSAQSYLRYSGFSRQRLIKQLEYEKYSTADATAAVDALVVDWNQEAAECAASYMKTSSFSRDKLYDQLIYEGFTPSQAEYGVQSVGY